MMTTRDYTLGPPWHYTPGPYELCQEGIIHNAVGTTCYPLLRYTLRQCEQPGYGIEFGVQTGHSLRLISQRLRAVGFDSFQGLPEDWGIFPKGTFRHDPPTIPDTRLVIGMFADTLPTFDFATVDPLRLVHIDCDLYSSTKTVLEYLGPHLTSGVYVVLDDFWPGDQDPKMSEDHVQRAWREFADTSGIDWEVVGGQIWSAGTWSIRIGEVSCG